MKNLQPDSSVVLKKRLDVKSALAAAAQIPVPSTAGGGNWTLQVNLRLVPAAGAATPTQPPIEIQGISIAVDFSTPGGGSVIPLPRDDDGSNKPPK
jgi:hypothetical protein